jgi:hypothetical protein
MTDEELRIVDSRSSSCEIPAESMREEIGKLANKK